MEVAGAGCPCMRFRRPRLSGAPRRAGKGVKRKAGRPKGRDGARPAKRPAAPARSVGVVAPGQQCTQCGTQVCPTLGLRRPAPPRLLDALGAAVHCAVPCLSMHAARVHTALCLSVCTVRSSREPLHAR